ncbi:alpha-1,6-mannosyltransferase Och1 [Schizosaccharomyces japonicus yFS275]|uniref:Alpha-1,6-mannosyltransferase Och1 n=1 Tax=Schizosaccharomyces japonicus (strain yFS275 / FY16936) TaxID=402676 RepID=B6K7Q4_SCHJY|nr:alpha-1,6-mannosyltransferase Och1 [Schizosaccharomyces japonicus yFS275]EEB09558.1 alpha-1,6-mannosyltransferase Och1 [Schizosaccharomyces japonicus yFS275]
MIKRGRYGLLLVVAIILYVSFSSISDFDGLNEPPAEKNYADSIERDQLKQSRVVQATATSTSETSASATPTASYFTPEKNNGPDETDDAAVDENDTEGGYKYDETSPEMFNYVKDDVIAELRQMLPSLKKNKQAIIPKTIWQTLKSFDSEGYLGYINLWTKANPGYVHAVLTDDDAEEFLREHFGDESKSRLMEYFFKLPEPVMKADFFRYLSLLAEGGYYTDIDTSPIKPIDKWVPAKFKDSDIGMIVGIEADPDRPDWNDYYARRVQFCQWTIAAVPNHPILWDMAQRITKETIKRAETNKLDTRYGNVMEWTGPGVWTDAVMDYLDWNYGPFSWKNVTNLQEPMLVGDVLVLPITAFSPGVGHMNSKSFDHPSALVRHHFSGSWKATTHENKGH